jgi:hypothetical protein
MFPNTPLKFTALLGLSWLGLGASLPAAVIISANFTDSSASRQLLATDEVGVVAALNWNNVGATGAGPNYSLTDVVDNSGAATTTDISITGTVSSYGNNTDLTGTSITGAAMDDAKMMSLGRGTSQNGDARTIVVSSIDTAIMPVYDIYVYFGGAGVDATTPYYMKATLQYWNGTAYVDDPGYSTLYMRDNNKSWDGIYTESTATSVAEATVDSDYVVFRNVSLERFRIMSDSQARRAGYSGIQIVAVPEAGAGWLGCLGLVAFLARRRR